MPTSARMGYPYPAKDQDPWDATFNDFVNAVDQADFAGREDRHFMITKGGTLSFTASSGLLTWSDAIELTSALTGFLIRIAAGSLSGILEGDYLYVDLVRGPTGNIGVVLNKAQQVPSTNSAFAIGIRKDGRIYFRTGAVLGDGDSLPIFETGGTGLPSILSAQVYVGNSANAPQARTLTGDVAIDNAGVTAIQPLVVDTAELAPGAVTPAKADLSVNWAFAQGAKSALAPTAIDDLTRKDYVDSKVGVTAHSALTGLGPPADDHPQYAHLPGRTGGQTYVGGTGSGEDLTLASTAHGTKGSIIVSDEARFAADMTMVGDNDFVPNADTQGEIGTSGQRFGAVRAVVVEAGDLHLRSSDGGAHWVLQEAVDGIFVENKLTGKRYRMVLEEVSGW